jgi:cytidylate kinase
VTRLSAALGDVLEIAIGTMSAWELAAAPILLAGLVLAGVWAARRDFRSYVQLLRRGFAGALLLVGSGAVVVGWFVCFDTATITGTETTPAAQTSWILSMALFSAGVSLLSGVAAYALGGWLSGAVNNDGRYNLIIAIDGPAASGKGTLAKRIAAHFGYAWLDTGLLYRAVARDVLATGGRLDDVEAATRAARAIDAASLADPALRGPRAGDAASIVAKIPEVRAALLAYQRAFARQPGGAVLDGRDIGTVVCPDADVKIFVTASDEARARRRFLEHQSRGENISYEELLADIRTRDARDQSRAIAPLEAAGDALYLDTTNLDADEAFEAAMEMIAKRTKCRET